MTELGANWHRGELTSEFDVERGWITGSAVDRGMHIVQLPEG